VGLGDGEASAVSDSAAEPVGSGEIVADGAGEEAADGTAGLVLGTVGVAEADGAEVDGAEVDGGVALAVPDDDGEPDGVAVHPASTPAHSRALRAVTERLTTSG
jgi:hypothetical protein